MSWPPLVAVGPLPASTIDGYRNLGVHKPADTTRTATTTFASDPHLQHAVETNAVYLVRLRAAIESPAAADFKWQWSVPAGATLNRYTYDVSGSRGTLATATSTANMATTGTPGAGIGDALTLDGTLIVGSTAGTLAWQWAQNVSDAGNTIVLAGASLSLVRIA